MSSLGDTIKAVGQQATIVRDSGNIYTYVYVEAVGRVAGKRKLEPEEQHELGYLFLPDSGIVSGDLVIIGSEYYLVMSLTDLNAFGTKEAYRGMLYKCNSTISVYHYNPATNRPDLLYKENVRCLITQAWAQEWNDDKALIVENFRGRKQPFSLYAQESSGIKPDKRDTTVVVDQDGRRFRVGEDFDMFVTGGIVQAQVLLES